MSESPSCATPCVLTYVCMCVCAFRENLEKLLEDKHFREEIVHFNISEETEVVDASHRARLIPLLMRYCMCECMCCSFIEHIEA